MAKISTLIILLFVFLGMVFTALETFPLFDAPQIAHQADTLLTSKIEPSATASAPQMTAPLTANETANPPALVQQIEEALHRESIQHPNSFEEFIQTPVTVITSLPPVPTSERTAIPLLPPFLVTPGH